MTPIAHSRESRQRFRLLVCGAEQSMFPIIEGFWRASVGELAGRTFDALDKTDLPIRKVIGELGELKPNLIVIVNAAIWIEDFALLEALKSRASAPVVVVSGYPDFNAEVGRRLGIPTLDMPFKKSDHDPIAQRILSPEGVTASVGSLDPSPTRYRQIVPPWLLACVAAFCFAAIGDIPYEYYRLLRWTVCAVAISAALQFYLNRSFSRLGWIWVLGVAALIFNPVTPFHFPRETWRIIDAATGLLFLVVIGKISSDRKATK